MFLLEIIRKILKALKIKKKCRNWSNIINNKKNRNSILCLSTSHLVVDVDEIIMRLRKNIFSKQKYI